MWKKILGGLVAFVITVIALIFWATAGMSDTADNFFATLHRGDYIQAYRLYLSADFKSNTPEPAFEQFVKQNRLDKVKETHWGNREVSGMNGTLEGGLVTDDGDAIPITLKFVKADEVWQIYAIVKAPAGIQDETPAQTEPQEKKHHVTLPPSYRIDKLPSEEEQRTLAKNTMNLFFQGIQEKSFRRLYDEGLSPVFKKYVTLQQMNEKFASVMNASLDWGKIFAQNPVCDNAEIEKNAILHLKCHYPSTPETPEFDIDLQYVRDNGKWGLTAISFNAK